MFRVCGNGSHIVLFFVLSFRYSKFVLKFASDLFFIILLIVDTTLTDGFLTLHVIQSRPTHALLLVWVLGIAWREIKLVYSHGASTMKQLSHWRDMLLVLFFVLGIAFDTATVIMYHYETSGDVTSEVKRDTSFMYSQPYRSRPTYLDSGHPLGEGHTAMDLPILHRVARASKPRGNVNGRDDGPDFTVTHPEYLTFLAYEWWHPKLLASAMFAMSTVISFLRMLQYVVVSDVIGPFQISLGSMVSQTANFFLVLGIILFSFAVGLTYMFSYYDKVQSLSCAADSSVECEDSRFSNLFFGVLYLFWSALGFESQDPLFLSNQAVVIEKTGLVLYAAFYILIVIVLLNALIAVMSEAYNNVEENADTEWKFHSTVMWMNILLDDDVIPPPFNLLPSTESIKKFIDRCRRSRKKCRRGEDDTNSDDDKIEMENRSKRKNADNKSQYKRVINKLVARYVTDKTKDGESANAEVNITDILVLKNELQSLKLELFQRIFETNHSINKTTVDGHTIRDTSTRAKTVLNKTGDIHDNVDTIFKNTVHDFKTSVLTHKDNILKHVKEVEEFELNATKDEGFFSSFYPKESAKSYTGDSNEGLFSSFYPKESAKSHTGDSNSSVGAKSSTEEALVKTESLDKTEDVDLSDKGSFTNRMLSLLHLGSNPESRKNVHEKNGRTNGEIEFGTANENISMTKKEVHELERKGFSPPNLLSGYESEKNFQVKIEDLPDGATQKDVSSEGQVDYHKQNNGGKESKRNSTYSVSEEYVILDEPTQSSIENETVKQSDKSPKNESHTDSDKSILSAADTQSTTGIFSKLIGSDKEPAKMDLSTTGQANIQNGSGISSKQGSNNGSELDHEKEANIATNQKETIKEGKRNLAQESRMWFAMK
ncbi:uncharacterized protein [Amphiura filiformis]|uniref:uncharacterized protein n=1 Tax=Amphiura filiformis TaxID=82378 RepID=UPI003B20C4A7